MLLIPAIDIRGGRCVRLLQGRFDAETVYAEDPGDVLAQYLALGARRIHVVDLDGARAGSQGNSEALGRLVAAATAVVLLVVKAFTFVDLIRQVLLLLVLAILLATAIQPLVARLRRSGVQYLRGRIHT